jgi:hypothetical protein
MIGQLTDRDTNEPLATLEDSGEWSPVGDGTNPLTRPLVALLDAGFHPFRNDEAGDHHLPFGVMAMNRAAAALGLRVTLAKEIAPLPEGAIA